ncbi:universal stress protein [Natrinema sp. 1APR25-10V2]|uniref:universal stress protein n=1 Tax=Natrinema sp. 1APR25-10V2 TaxID=2951081 RepID=UPI00287712C9|nr:universal stress protein [Natrinema sp. 1APR25-10V2]MDS0477699.1 universal stress protein [Natrinema sp. 1APR25-10V2]
MYETVLVPTDGSSTATTAARGAIALAQRFDASLHAISVLENGDLPDDLDPETLESLTDSAERALTAVEDLTADAGVAATTSLVDPSGPVHEAIVDYALEHDVDVIVMGTHGRTGADRLVIGSVAERTLRVSPIPVLAVPEAAVLERDFGRILVPTDGSEPATAAADHAIALATATDAMLQVVHVVDTDAVPEESAGASVLEAFEAAGQHAVDDVVDRADEAGVRAVEASVLSGTPAQAILDYAAQRDTALVVVGTHGRAGLDRYLLGSVTENVVRRAETPVLAVSPPDER